MELRRHDVVLRDREIVLRPMTERDWPLLSRWSRRVDVLRWTDGPGTEAWDLAKRQHVYRTVSEQAYCFIIKWKRAEIGECWLQRMNLPEVLARYPGADVRRIDLAIFEPRLWSRGIGTRVIARLAQFGFDEEGADAIFGMVGADNTRSRRAFEHCGFALDQTFDHDDRATELKLILRPADAESASSG